MRDKREIIRMHVSSGITGLDDIRKSYNSYGGLSEWSNQMYVQKPDNTTVKPQTINRVAEGSSEVDFGKIYNAAKSIINPMN
jgi:hypothetical protein